ncbi:hypothetical protein SLS54_004799 [Diplodia seriata]
MLARTVLARLRAKVPSAAARDVAQLSCQLRSALASTTNNATAAAPLSVAQFQRIRGYATATATKTRASTAAKKAPAKKAAATKKTAASAKKTTATKKKPAPKPKKKAAAKPKPKKKELTPTQIERLEKRKARAAEQKQKDTIKQLKETALKEPKQKPSTAYTILLMETVEKEGVSRGVPEIAKAVSQKYKNLAPAELERLNRLANEADQENKKAYKKWVESYTPLEIRLANNARRQLKSKLVSYPKSQIRDDRALPQPHSAYILFTKERHASGDFKGIRTIEAGKLIGKEWTALSATDKKKYEDLAEAARQTYQREFKRVYGIESASAKAAAPA